MDINEREEFFQKLDDLEYYHVGYLLEKADDLLLSVDEQRFHITFLYEDEETHDEAQGYKKDIQEAIEAWIGHEIEINIQFKPVGVNESLDKAKQHKVDPMISKVQMVIDVLGGTPADQKTADWMKDKGIEYEQAD